MAGLLFRGVCRGPKLTEVELNKRLLRVEETAGYLSISPRTIYNEISRGTCPLKAKKLGMRALFDLNDLDAYVDSIPHEKEDRP